ncbi:hypothetical protein BDV98DRAFT_580389 [Pterulicium gracile]|uniref:Uncharacterized protein n=1 Tax=Pterulicium gracile TaxID=1884261 RepID=A0A5C3QXL3_9AGAR|nr:hypothetical protein BDV98DRAFT_580389 [Pterula gracilis]
MKNIRNIDVNVFILRFLIAEVAGELFAKSKGGYSQALPEYFTNSNVGRANVPLAPLMLSATPGVHHIANIPKVEEGPINDEVAKRRADIDMDTIKVEHQTTFQANLLEGGHQLQQAAIYTASCVCLPSIVRVFTGAMLLAKKFAIEETSMSGNPRLSLWKA